MSAKRDKLVIMVSSSVYGIEELLNRLYTLLTAYGYEVWMSHKGTMPVFSNRSAFENCLVAVEKCDLFLGLVTPNYGSGKEDRPGALSITHQELRKAVALKKPRWVLAHDHVVFARALLKNLGYADRKARQGLSLKKTPMLDDLRVIDMYEDAILSDRPLRERQGNWVQQYQEPEDAALFATAQFFRYQEVEAFVKESFADPVKVSKVIANPKGGQP